MTLNPHQFGDQGTLFDAPLGQPHKGVFKGNPAARLYRNVVVPDHVLDRGVDGIMDHLNRSGKDSGVSRTLGIHWQHDLGMAESYNDHTVPDGHSQVFMEADHPGHKHVLDPESIPDSSDLYGARSSLKPGTDAHTMFHTVVTGGGIKRSDVEPEVPIRPGAPMRITALYTPSREVLGEYDRNATNVKGTA